MFSLRSTHNVGARQLRAMCLLALLSQVAGWNLLELVPEAQDMDLAPGTLNELDVPHQATIHAHVAAR